MIFSWCTITVKDLDESINFYENIIGLELTKRFKAGNTECAFLGQGETKVELIKVDDHNSFDIGLDISLGFETENLDNELNVLKDNEVNILTDVIKPTPHIKFVKITDPNGVKIQILENIK